MSKGKKASVAPKQVEALRHRSAKRKNIPTAELQSAAQRAEEAKPVAPVVYSRRYPLAQDETRPRDNDLDPQLVWKGARVRLTADQIKKAATTGYIDISDSQLVWRGKDQQDWSDLVVQAPPLYIQEKIHPKAIVDDLTRQTRTKREADSEAPDLFHDFNGVDPEAKTDFYLHDQNWSNRFILGDSLQVMASLAEREGLRGQVQCIYFDPPYGIKFNSNWQVSTRSRDVKDGKIEEISREPEQVRAFRDTWKDGIHSYLTYLRDRVTAMRDMLTPSGSIFVQIGDENVHRIRSILDEVFGEDNFLALINFKTADPLSQKGLPKAYSYIAWYARDANSVKFRPLTKKKNFEDDREYKFFQKFVGQNGIAQADDDDTDADGPLRKFRRRGAWSAGYTESCTFPFQLFGKTAVAPGGKSWATNPDGVDRLKKADRLFWIKSHVYFKRFTDDYDVVLLDNNWSDKPGAGGEIYVVQTAPKFVQRCILMTTDPGDLVLDPTCGSGTTAYVAEQWGRRWITIDTSRVALALARARVMGARYPYYTLSDSKEGRLKEAQLTGRPPVEANTHGDIRQGFVYERAPHITLKSVANNAEINVVWDEFQAKLEPLRQEMNGALGKKWEEWEVPYDAPANWSDNVKGLHRAWSELREARQKKIDESIAKKSGC